MTINKATDRDIPEIVALLKLSLGEGSSIKSEAYWRWKHIDNPYGQSPVVMAVQDDKLVGVRAFMPWDWSHFGEKLTALRAVDTATHPEYQGKGIFKKLTLKLLDDSKSAGNAFIFNTPNKQSLPGYLKMGWEQLGKINIRVFPVAPHRSLLHKLMTNDQPISNRLAQYGQWNELSTNWENEINGQLSAHYADRICPMYHQGYLDWRYAKCPVQQYYFVQEQDFLIIFYPKRQSIGVELRLAELWLKPNVSIRYLKTLLKQLAKTAGASYISLSHLPHLSPQLSNMGFLKHRQIGPMMTFRALNYSLTSEQKTLDGWLPLMGAMELF